MSMKTSHYKGLDFRAAITNEEYAQLEQVCKVVYVAEFGSEPLGSREFDADATLFGAWRDGMPLGTLRFVPDGPRGLPMEAVSETSCDPWRKRGKICELGRFAVHRQTDMAPFIIMGLLCVSFWHAVDTNVSFLMACAPRRIWTLYKRMGMRQFGRPFQHPVGEEFVLGAFNVSEELARACGELEQGIHDNMLHEILERRTVDEDHMLRKYLTQQQRPMSA